MKIEPKIDSGSIRDKLKLRSLEAKSSFSDSHPEVIKFFQNKGIEIEKLREHSAKLLAGGAITGTLLIAYPELKALSAPTEIVQKFVSAKVETDLPQKNLSDSLTEVLPKKVRPLSREEEKYLERLFELNLGLPVRATLEGEHLNTTYGLIGLEQHLRRFPGDALSAHDKDRAILRAGIAPGLGAWGYFAPSANKLSVSLTQAEKWYAVVQTLYLPDWQKRAPYLRDWYKYRKVLIVNTLNGNAVVCSIADSGPAAWTGKVFGASPEAMYYLGGPRYTKGPVIVFFVDDPGNQIPLGPLYNKLI